MKTYQKPELTLQPIDIAEDILTASTTQFLNEEGNDISLDWDKLV